MLFPGRNAEKVHAIVTGSSSSGLATQNKAGPFSQKLTVQVLKKQLGSVRRMGTALPQQSTVARLFSNHFFGTLVSLCDSFSSSTFSSQQVAKRTEHL